MRFLKKDLAKQLCEVISQEERQLTILEKKIPDLQSAWVEQQAICCRLASLFNSFDFTYQPGVNETCFREYRESLTEELKRAVAKRDELTGDLPREIRELRERTEKRLRIVSGRFGGFISGLTSHTLSGGSTPQCNAELLKKLNSARREAEAATDPAKLLSLIRDIVEEVEGLELQFCPLLNLDSAIEKALAVGDIAEVA